jgi:hypothetical protein
MNRKSCVAMLTTVLLGCQSMAMAESGPIELRWSELSLHIQGRDIQLVLPDGTSLNGEVEAVREDALVLNVKNTSAAAAHPKGNAVIPRDSVSLLLLKESRARWGRTIGVSLGSITGATLGGYVAATHANSSAAGLSTFLAVTAAGTLAGYFLGKSADRRVKHIRVVP